jgi:alpha-tubulin suppressor-like RCC1 family protein
MAGKGTGAEERLLCTGGNFFGQLGIGYRTRSQPPDVPSTFGENGMEQITPGEVQDIQCGTQFTVVVKRNGEVL